MPTTFQNDITGLKLENDMLKARIDEVESMLLSVCSSEVDVNCLLKATDKTTILNDIAAGRARDCTIQISEIRYRRLFEAAHDGIILIDPSTRKIVEANPFICKLLNFKREYLIGKELFEIGLLKDEVISQEMFEKLKINHEIRYDDLPLESKNGQLKEVEVIANVYDENGISIIQCNIRDITEHKRSEDHIKLLMAEVNHRAKNLLTVVQIIAQRTARYSDPGQFEEILCQRIASLAAGQDLLVKTEWHGTEIYDIIVAQLTSFQHLINVRIILNGPVIKIAPAPAQGIGMALHELATNAIKYGSLSNDDGIVHVTWKIIDNIFSINWIESNGPKVIIPTKKGFGQIVIEKLAKASVNGNVTVDFREDGLFYELQGPIINVLMNGGQSNG
jgi:PAS domain S-box-containing protein